jgi:hypothetical protein
MHGETSFIARSDNHEQMVMTRFDNASSINRALS